MTRGDSLEGGISITINCYPIIIVTITLEPSSGFDLPCSSGIIRAGRDGPSQYLLEIAAVYEDSRAILLILRRLILLLLCLFGFCHFTLVI